MSYRGRSPKPQVKASPMLSPSISGVGALSSRGVPPSPLSKGLDGAFGSSSSPSVDYDDVFGGPPRFATSVFASDSGLSSSAMLDRVSARTPSFRPSSSPVFELPVFGDDVFRSGSSVHESRPASVSYEDIFREDVHTPDVFPATTMYGNSLSNISRSRPSSRCSSRCMSPAHPAASIPGQIGEDDFFKHRPSAGKLSDSMSSFDDNRGKSLESPFTISRSNKAMATASLPSSPPKVENWSNLKKFSGSNSAKSLTNPPSVDNDDVFGGFPQRSFPQPFTAVQYDDTDAMEATGMGEKPNKVAIGNKVPSSPSVGQTLIYSEGPSVAQGNKVPSSPSVGQTLIFSEGLSRSLSTSSSSNDEQGQQDELFEIRMDKRSDSSISEKGESMAGKIWVTVNDLRHSTQPPQRRPLSRPPPVPASQLKYKSWKDWASDLPASAASSGSKIDATVAVPALLSTPFSEQKDLNNGETISKFVKDWVENVPSKQIEDSMSLHQGLGKHTGSAPFRSKVNKKVVEESVELEERELQAMLTNAWRLNEKREREKAVTNKPRIQGAPAKSKPKGQEPLLEEETMSLDEQSKPSPSQRSKDVVEGKTKQSIESQPQLSRHILDERVRQLKMAQPQKCGHNSKQRVRQSKVSQPQESTHYNEDKVKVDISRQSKVSQSQQSTLDDEDNMTSADKVPTPQETRHHDVDQTKLNDAGQEFKGGNEQAKTFQHAQSSTYNGDADLHWKAWWNKERKQSTKNGVDVPEKTTTKVPSSGVPEPVVESTGASLEPNGVLEPEDLFDPEVIVQVVMEEVPTKCSIVSKGVPEKGADVDLRTKSIESGNGNALSASKGQLQSESGIASTLHASGGPEKDVVQCTDEQVDLSQSEGGEELDCLLGLDPSSLDGFQEIEGESLERRKARWERHLRARERGAKALDEMQKRDAEVQRQQAEKQQLAEMSDRQIKCWAAGKEGNLRALLSNLQHVLWPESGWQPIGLTNLIEGPDVKKAYRKATLFFHPDKMQQKGATLQQKYIAERVFDILQEAWKTFNMQELF